MATYRVEVIGPTPIGNGKEYWAIFIFNDKGIRIGQFDASSKKEADKIKDDLIRGLQDLADE